MNKFKVGDKVRLLDSYLSYEKTRIPQGILDSLIGKPLTIERNDDEVLLLEETRGYKISPHWVEAYIENDFQSEQEIWQWLVDGNTIKNDSNELIKFINGKLMVKYNCNNNFSVCYNMEISILENWSKYQEPKWFENIPGQGILCWVWRDDEKIEDKSLEVVINHNNIENSTYPFTTLSTIYKYATPASLEEIEKYILKQ